jgi:tRNA modification GTPase
MEIICGGKRSMADTIAALSTAPAKSGVAVIRISGDRSLDIAKRVFRPAYKGKWVPRMMTYGTLLNSEGIAIDSILGVWFRGPNSYTGEDIVELHCHGSLAVLNTALSTLYSYGARPAEPGEFTKRAFMNGRLDLSQAEAVGDLIEAVTEEGAVNATAQIQGALSRELGRIYDDLTDLLAHFQAVVDYPDEDIEDFGIDNAVSILENAAEQLNKLTEGYKRGKVLREGIDCVIIGRPNVGKSSLLNMLVGDERAIVTPIAGTTRDIIEAYAKIGGVTLKLRDTAGIRRTDDMIEDIGVDRAIKAAKDASLVLAVVDGSQPLSDEDRDIMEHAVGKRGILLINKSDKPQDESLDRDLREWSDKFIRILKISAKTGQGMDELEAVVNTLYSMGELRLDGTLITNARQEGTCKTAELLLRGAINNLRYGYPPDMVLYDVEQALMRIGEILGKNTPIDIVDKIFANFCVGK